MPIGALDLELPSDPESETVVIGSIFAASQKDPEYFLKVAEMVDEDRFHVEKNRLVFSAMRHCFAKSTVHPAAVRSELERRGDLVKVGSLSDFEAVSEVQNIEGFCNNVNEMYRLRRLHHSFEALKARIHNREESEKILAEAQQLIAKAESSLPQDDNPTPMEIVERAGGLKPFLFPEREYGVMTPYRRFNDTTNGLRPGLYSMVGGKPGTGKTSFACEVALNAAFNGHHVKFDSHEMLKEDLLRRMAFSHAKVDSRQARAGKLSPEDTYLVSESLSKICSLDNLRISDSGNRTVAAVRRDHRRQEAQGTPIKLRVIDYIQKMHAVGRFERRQLELASISDGLQQTAHDFKTHVMSLSQLSVDAKEQFDKDPTEDDYREAKDIGQDIDLGVILRLKDAEQRYEVNRQVNMYVVKQRHGPTGMIPYIFESVTTSFKEIPRELEEQDYAAEAA